MTQNAARATTLMRALHAGIAGDTSVIPELCTDDVKVWAPAMSATSAIELAAELERRDDAFSNIELEIAPLDVGGDYACAEWCVTMTHSGRLVLADGMIIEPTGLRIHLNGATVAEFRGERICSLRQYWDELAVLEQLGVLSDEEGQKG
jgi:ketosteroid isomerase-like protein